MTRYREAFAWTGTIDKFLPTIITESPVLNVCSGPTLGGEGFGDVTVDLYEPADVRADWIDLPFPDDTFGAVFADPPWNSGYKLDSAKFIREALRIAPVAYLMAPWIYGASWSSLTNVWFREFPGVNTPIVISRYIRKPTHTILT